MPVGSGEWMVSSSVKLWFWSCVVVWTQPHICVANQIFFFCFHRDDKNDALSVLAVQKHHALCNLIHFFKSFAVFYFQVHCFNPFEERKQPLCRRWTQNLSSKLKLQVLLMCQVRWQAMCPSPFLSEQFSPVRQSKFSIVSYFWLHAASRGDKALDVENFQSSLHNDTIRFSLSP